MSYILKSAIPCPTPVSKLSWGSRLYRIVPLLSASILLGWLVSCNGCQKPTPQTPEQKATAPRIDTTARIVMEVSKCARLYTTEYQIHKIVTHSDAPTLEGKVLGMSVKVPTRLGDRKVAIPIDVTLKAYIDFAEFSERNIQRPTDSTIVVTLPDPHILATSTRIDNRGTRQYIDLARSRYTDAEITEYARQGTDSILSHIGEFGITQQAERSAATALVPLIQRMGYQEEHITVRFRKNFSNPELIRMIQKN